MINNIKVSENFKLYEFECRDGNKEVKVDDQLVIKLQKLRDLIERPITIVSAYRNPEYNKRVGGVANSQHVLGKAADIKVNGMTPKQVAKYAESAGFTGIGIYDSFTHVDVRTSPARWNG